MKQLIRAIALSVTLVVGACSASDDSDSTGNNIATAEQALGVTGGDVPLPAKVVNGVPQVSWNGSYAELLAADALAMCWTTQAERGFRGGTSDSELFLRGHFGEDGRGGLQGNLLNPAVTRPEDVLYCAWMDSREAIPPTAT